MLTNNQKFKQWEGRIFGYGYGSGEECILEAVKVFFDNLEEGRCYDYELLEKKLGKTVCWLLINALCKGNVIEYGTSSRHGWLTSCGEYVRDFIRDKTVDELYEILFEDEDEDIICECDGEIKGHKDCGKNEMVSEKYADELKYKK